MLLVYKDQEIYNKVKLTKLVRKEKLFNLNNFSDVNKIKDLYGIKVPLDHSSLEFLLSRRILLNDYHCINYANTCGINNFDSERYLSYIEYKKRNKRDTSSVTHYKLKYGDLWKVYKDKKPFSKANPYSYVEVMEKYNLSKEEAILKVKALKNSTSGNLKRYTAKYGEEEGTKRYNTFCTKSKANLENYIRVHGEIEGRTKYYKANTKKSFSNTLEGFKLKYGEEEGTIKHKKVQKDKSSSLENCIKKYGKEEGSIRYKLLIKQRAFSSTLKGYITKYGEEKGATIYQKILYKKMVPFCQASKQSLEVIFKDLYSYLVSKGYSKEDLRYGVKGNSEHFIYTKNNTCFYDFTILSKKIIIEFHGERFHPNKLRLSLEEWKNWKCLFRNFSADTIHKYDNLKRKIAEEAGFNYFIVWSDDDNSKILEKIIQEFNL